MLGARAVAGPPPAVGRERRVPAPKLLIAGTAIALSFAYLVLMGMQSATVYYVTATELRAGGGPAGQVVRVGGRVVDGSIERDDRSLTLRFAISDRPRDGEGGAEVPVVYRGVVPDLFGYAKEGYYQDVVVEGRYTRDGMLQAQQLLVSHGGLQEAEAAARAGGSPGR